MENLNKLLSELGISKVRLAKYLGVSRQMLYNYLGQNSISEWPKEKEVKLLSLFGIKNGNEIKDLIVDGEFLITIEGKLKVDENNSNEKELYTDLKDFNKKEQELLSNIINLLKERLIEDKSKDTYNAYSYLYNYLQAIPTNKELKYLLAYISKSLGYTQPTEFIFNENNQFIFESIMFSAMSLYNSGGASKSKISETHKKFVKELENKKEEKLSRTQELNTAKIQALRELGFNTITGDNAKEVLERIAEIQSRKIG